MRTKNLISSVFFTSAILFGLMGPSLAFAIANYDVTTYSAEDVCQNGAVLNGYVNPFFTTDTMRWFEWGTSRDSLPNRTNSTRNGSNTEYFQETIYGLTPKTVYYFRAAAQNSKGAGYGEVLSFRTGSNTPCSTPSNSSSGGNTTSTSNTASNTTTNTAAYSNTTTGATVITKIATDIFDTNARLNAVVLPNSAIPTYGWFQWGTSPEDLGRVTNRKLLGSGASLAFNEMVYGLTPGTTYFFRPVVENQNGRFEGALFSFRTTGVSPAVSTASVFLSGQNPPTTKTQTPKTTTKASTKTNSPVISEKKSLKVEVIPESDVLAPKEKISETIQVENMTDTTVKDVVVRVVLSCDVTYVPTGGDDFIQNGTMLTHTIGEMKPKEKKNLLLWMNVGEGVADKAPIETIAVVNWENKTLSNSTTSAQNVGRAVAFVDRNKVAKENVAALGVEKSASSVFPGDMKDWGAVVGFMFLLFSAYMVFLVTRGKKEAVAAAEEVPVQSILPTRKDMLEKSWFHQREYRNDPFVTKPKTIATEPMVSHSTIATIPPVARYEKKTTIKKWAPPDNLPV